MLPYQLNNNCVLKCIFYQYCMQVPTSFFSSNWLGDRILHSHFCLCFEYELWVIFTVLRLLWKTLNVKTRILFIFCTRLYQKGTVSVPFYQKRYSLCIFVLDCKFFVCSLIVGHLGNITGKKTIKMQFGFFCNFWLYRPFLWSAL